MMPEPEMLKALGQLELAALETLPLHELDHLITCVASYENTAREYKHILHAVMHQRFGELARQLRQQAGKTNGTVRFDEEGFTIIADLPKRAEWDQKKLKDAVAALGKWGENPEDYVGIEIKVSETKYSAWPPAVRQLFEPARTLKTGRPTYKLARMQAGEILVAANDATFAEGV